MELQTILGTDKGRNAFYKARDNFSAIQSFINQLKAADVKFDNTDTEMTAEDVQAAINELNDNFIELYNTDATLSGQIENLNTIKENKQWMPNDWKAENDKSSAYPTGVTYFVINNPWYNGRIGNNAVIKTTKYNDFVTKQEAFRSSEISEGAIFIRQVHITDNLPWGAWEKIVTDKQPNWITATLQNGWTGNLYYRISQTGQLEIHGALTAGTIAAFAVIGKLIIPTLNIPAKSLIAYNNQTGEGLTNIRLLSSGDITISNSTNGIAAGNTLTLNEVINL